MFTVLTHQKCKVKSSNRLSFGPYSDDLLSLLSDYHAEKKSASCLGGDWQCGMKSSKVYTRKEAKPCLVSVGSSEWVSAGFV